VGYVEAIAFSQEHQHPGMEKDTILCQTRFGDEQPG
jgi:hypothetical protein